MEVVFGEIGVAYESGRSAREISVSSGLSEGRVYRILRKLGVARRKCGRPRRTELTERERSMIALYESDKTLEEVGLSFGITRERVRQILNKRGNGTRGPRGRRRRRVMLDVTRRPRGRPKRGAEPTERERAMIALYESGKTLNEVGIAFGVTRERVRQILNKRGNGTRGKSASIQALAARTQEQVATIDAEVRAAHSLGLHPAAIRQITGLSQRTIWVSTTRQGLRPNKRSDTKISKALRLFDEGLSARQIMRAAGFKNENSLRVALLRNGRHFTSRAHTGGAG